MALHTRPALPVGVLTLLVSVPFDVQLIYVNLAPFKVAIGKESSINVDCHLDSLNSRPVVRILYCNLHLRGTEYCNSNKLPLGKLVRVQLAFIGEGLSDSSK